MQRLVATSLNTVTLQEVEKPEVQPGEILVQTLVTCLLYTSPSPRDS